MVKMPVLMLKVLSFLRRCRRWFANDRLVAISVPRYLKTSTCSTDWPWIPRGVKRGVRDFDLPLPPQQNSYFLGGVQLKKNFYQKLGQGCWLSAGDMSAQHCLGRWATTAMSSFLHCYRRCCWCTQKREWGIKHNLEGRRCWKPTCWI